MKQEVTAGAQWGGSMEEEETSAPLPPASLQSTKTGEETWTPGTRLPEAGFYFETSQVLSSPQKHFYFVDLILDLRKKR